MSHYPGEQGTDLLRINRHAPGGITAAHAGLDDALVVAETTHRAPPSPFTRTEEPEGRLDTEPDRLMRASRSTGDDSTPESDPAGRPVPG